LVLTVRSVSDLIPDRHRLASDRRRSQGHKERSSRLFFPKKIGKPIAYDLVLVEGNIDSHLFSRDRSPTGVRHNGANALTMAYILALRGAGAEVCGPVPGGHDGGMAGVVTSRMRRETTTSVPRACSHSNPFRRVRIDDFPQRQLRQGVAVREIPCVWGATEPTA
jgi:hypothetical protein